MPRLRLLLAALLLIAFTLGVSAHAASMHGMPHAGGTAVALVHDHGLGKKSSPDGHKLSSQELCQIACSGAVAVLGGPMGPVARFAYAAQFALAPPAAFREMTRAPDPFPPRPVRIA